MPTISIVLPTYNGEQYIKESINSVINQTFTDWELIIVNDCSSDNTAVIIEEYLKVDNRIKVIHNRINQKLPRSLNIGFQMAQGEFLTWTSDDNYYFPNALEVMHQYLCEKSEINMVCADMEKVDFRGEKQGILKIYNEEEMLLNNRVGACFLYRNIILEEVGQYDSEQFLVEDYDYWIRILRKYGRIGYIEKVLYAYRVHGNSLTTLYKKKVSKQLVNLRMRNINWILDNIKKKEDIYRLYYEFFIFNIDTSLIEEKIFHIMPVLKIIKREVDLKKEFIIFGAGDYGERAAVLLKDKVSYFVDSNSQKVGTYKCGKKILSISELMEIYPKYNIIVAVSLEKVLDILYSLYENGIEQCYTYQVMIEDNI